LYVYLLPLILTVDIGNSFTKIALLQEGEILTKWSEAKDHALDRIEGLILEHGSSLACIGWINVNQAFDLEAALTKRLKKLPAIFRIDKESNLPIENRYRSPETLGTDRIVSVIGGRTLVSTGNLLVIDAGTALTYDYAEGNAYLGGGIAPGMAMRFRALHEFTARLPLLSPEGKAELIGRNTAESIQSGVINGMLAEMDGVIRQYQDRGDGALSVILTGGDASFFEKRLKNINFASSNLIHLGIYHILTHLKLT